MNFLEICQRTRQEAGKDKTLPTTVVSQTGDLGRLVDWSSDANKNICNASMTWRFLRTTFSFSTVSTIQEYSPSDLSITDFATWITEHRDETGAIRIYSSVADESRLQYLPWDEFQEVYVFGTNRSQSQRPSVVSVKPDNSLILWPIPDAVYNINGERYKAAPTLDEDADEPEFPERFHMIVVWKAVIDYAGWTAADEKYAHAMNRYTAMLRKLQIDQREKMLHGPPLA